MKYCSNCGSELSENEKFCHSCGTKVEQNEINNEETKEPVVEETPVVEEEKEPVVEETPVVEEAKEPVVEEAPAVTSAPVVDNGDIFTQPPQMAQQNVGFTPVEPPKKKSNVGLIVLLVLLIAAIGGAGFLGGYLLFGNDSETEEKSDEKDKDEKDDEDNKKDEDEKDEDKDDEEDEKDEDDKKKDTEITVGGETIIIPKEFDVTESANGTQITNGEWLGIILEIEASYDLSKENIDVYTDSLETSGYEVIGTDIIKVNKNEYIEIELEQNGLELVVLMTEYNDINLMITMANAEGKAFDKDWYEEYDEILENSKK